MQFASMDVDIFHAAMAFPLASQKPDERVIRSEWKLQRIRLSVQKQNKEMKMKNYLMIGCAALAIIGCAHNRGGVVIPSSSGPWFSR